MIKRYLAGAVLAASLLAQAALAQPPQIRLEALFPPKAAVVSINGERKMLRVGQSVGGATLIAADATTATLRVDGKDTILGISSHVGSSYEQPAEQVVTIPRDSRLRYQTTAMINGQSVLVLVDTGANVMAMSSTQAKSLGIDYLIGQATMVETASGVAKAYTANLRSVSVGGIRVDNVSAMVVEGGYPAQVLLGMSYLRHVNFEEQNGILSLSRNR